MLGVPDAYELPRSPGHGYLKFGTEPLVRFKAAYVSGAGPPARRLDAVRRRARDAPGAVVHHALRSPAAPTPATAAVPAAGRRRRATAVLDVLVARLRRPGPAGPPGVAAAAGRAADAGRAARPGRRRPDPRAHRRQPGAARRAPGAGRRSSTSRSSSAATCCGCRWPARPGTSPWSAAPQSGKSTLLRTLIVRPGADPHAGRGAVLLPRLRRRRAGRAARPAARRRGRRAAGPGRRPPHRRRGRDPARRARAAVRRARRRLDGRVPQAARGGPASPTTRSATCSWSSTAGRRCAASSRTWSR